MIDIRPYRADDEVGWLRCRVLAFLDTAYFDNVLREKERYQHPAIELVAEIQGQIIGLMDVEAEDETGMLWHVAVHPDFQRQGIGTLLLQEARLQARTQQVTRLEAWTRDDAAATQWYLSQGFHQTTSYWHVFLEGGQEINGVLQSTVPGLMPVQAFAHYVGGDAADMGKRFQRVHECRLYTLTV